MRELTRVDAAGRWAVLTLVAAATIGATGVRHAAHLTQTSGGNQAPAAMLAASTDCSTDTALCLGEGRFLVEATWTKPDGESGPAHAVSLTADSGYFWFLDPNNVEVTVKALNGCGVNGRYWIFSAGLTNLAVAITVADMATNLSKTYSSPQGMPFQTVADTTTFAACLAGAESVIGNPEEPAANVRCRTERDHDEGTNRLERGLRPKRHGPLLEREVPS